LRNPRQDFGRGERTADRQVEAYLHLFLLLRLAEKR
jgi:hypothetical protein